MPDSIPSSDFVPSDLDATQWEHIEPYYTSLLARSLKTVKDVEHWLLDMSELDAAVAEARANLYIAMTRHTDDDNTQKAYRDFVETVSPQVSKAEFRLEKKLVECPLLEQIDAHRYQVLFRDTKVDVDLFRDENVPLETEETTLQQEYSQVFGAMVVTFHGEEKTLPQMVQMLEETDRGLREDAWRKMLERQFEDRDRINKLYDCMTQLRHRIGKNADFANYRDYAFRNLKRFDYTPEECFQLHESIERYGVPLLKRLCRERADTLKISELKPWDLNVDVLSRPPLRPFIKVDDLVEKCSKIFHTMDDELGDIFDALRGRDCLDLATRKGKAPGGYQYQRQRIRQPFIFMNATGMHTDLITLLHESGHAFHATLCRDEPLLHYRNYPSEFAEVASMGMELLTLPYLGEFYNKEDADRARRQQIERVINLLPWICIIDAFQHWVYTHPDHSHEERIEYWLGLLDRFAAPLDWSGLEHFRTVLWHRQLHLFECPFYYIEYAIAQLGALQLWRAARQEEKSALECYKRALTLGGSYPLPELFSVAGLTFDFSPSTVSELMKEVEKELATLPI